jgi:hypothetical protein
MRVVAGMLAALAVASASAAAPASGLRGVVTRTTPVCIEEEACATPAPGVVLRFTRAGDAVRVKSGPRGGYRVRLAPGTYTVSLVRRSRAELTPRVVRVPRGRLVRIDFHVDTGIQ